MKKSIYNQNVSDQECDDMEGNFYKAYVSLDFRSKISKVLLSVVFIVLELHTFPSHVFID